MARSRKTNSTPSSPTVEQRHEEQLNGTAGRGDLTGYVCTGQSRTCRRGSERPRWGW